MRTRTRKIIQTKATAATVYRWATTGSRRRRRKYRHALTICRRIVGREVFVMGTAADGSYGRVAQIKLSYEWCPWSAVLSFGDAYDWGEYERPEGVVKALKAWPRYVAWPCSMEGPEASLRGYRGRSVRWLRKVYWYVEAGDREAASDLYFERIDDLLCAGRWEAVDRILGAVEVRRLDAYLLVGFLSLTFQAPLPSYPAFFERVVDRVRELEPVRYEALIAGFEPTP